MPRVFNALHSVYTVADGDGQTTAACEADVDSDIRYFRPGQTDKTRVTELAHSPPSSSSLRKPFACVTWSCALVSVVFRATFS